VERRPQSGREGVRGQGARTVGSEGVPLGTSSIPPYASRSAPTYAPSGQRAAVGSERSGAGGGKSIKLNPLSSRHRAPPDEKRDVIARPRARSCYWDCPATSFSISSIAVSQVIACHEFRHASRLVLPASLQGLQAVGVLARSSAGRARASL